MLPIGPTPSEKHMMMMMMMVMMDDVGGCFR